MILYSSATALNTREEYYLTSYSLPILCAIYYMLPIRKITVLQLYTCTSVQVDFIRKTHSVCTSNRNRCCSAKLQQRSTSLQLINSFICFTVITLSCYYFAVTYSQFYFCLRTITRARYCEKWKIGRKTRNNAIRPTDIFRRLFVSLLNALPHNITIKCIIYSPESAAFRSRDRHRLEAHVCACIL